MTYLLKNVAFNTHPTRRSGRAHPPSPLSRGSLCTWPVTGDPVAITPNQRVRDIVRVVPCRYRCTVCSRFSKLFFSLRPRARLHCTSSHFLGLTTTRSFLSLALPFSRLFAVSYVHTCIVFARVRVNYRVLLTNAQRANVVKSCRNVSFASPPLGRRAAPLTMLTPCDFAFSLGYLIAV